MLRFDFANPYLLYVLWLALTGGIIVAFARWPAFFRRRQVLIGSLTAGSMLYVIFVDYLLPLGRGTFSLASDLPFYICRLTSVTLFFYAIFKGPRLLRAFLFLFGATSFFAIVFPAGPPANVANLDETYIIGHMVVALFPLHQYFVHGYLPSRRSALIQAGWFTVALIVYARIEAHVEWGYFFMNERNMLLPLWPEMPWTVFALLHGVGLLILFYTLSGYRKT